MSTTPDLSEVAAEAEAAPPVSSEDRLVQIQALAERTNELDRRIAVGEDLLKQLKKQRLDILQRDLVDVMADAGVEEVTVDGRKFTAGPYFKAAIPEEHRDAAHEWLEENEGGHLIDCTLVVSFPKDHLEEAQELRTYIIQRHQMASVELKRGVPWARLTAWVKEQYEEAKAIAAEEGRSMVFTLPLEILGATVGRIVKVKDTRR